MRSSLSGTLVVGLARVGLKAYPVSVQEPEDGSLHWLHRSCKSRLTQTYSCQVCGNLVDPDDRVKGVAHEGQWVLFEDEELKALQAPSQSDWELARVVPLSQVNMLWTDQFYYLLPAAAEDVRPYMLFAQTFATRQEGGIFTFTTRHRARLGVIRPGDPGLILHVLRFAESVRSCNDYGMVTTPITLTPKELRLARELLDSPWLRKPFQYSSYHNPEKERFAEQIQAKLTGEKKLRGPPAVTPTKVPQVPQATSLAKLLELSLTRAKARVKKAAG